MRIDFRNGFFAGIAAAVLLSAYLAWLWRPERQVRLHNEHLLAAVEAKNWAALGDFVDASYADQWGNDRALLLFRLKEIRRYARNLHIERLGVGVRFDRAEAECTARISISADENGVTGLIKQRVNNLDAPFLFRWRYGSGKPWDWKLTRASNDALDLPESATSDYFPSALRSSVRAASTSLSLAPQSKIARSRSPW
ncbi:MAG: hypothetical protein M3032_12580 [Verrucomicrobiota bacterium]|nr:hypothetical protein [Verrucomicrobiota bacterium]